MTFQSNPVKRPAASRGPETCLDAGKDHRHICSPAYEGTCGHVSLRTGLRMHYCDGVDLQNFSTSGDTLPGLVFYYFLHGVPEATIGGVDLVPEDERAGVAVHGLVMNRLRPEILERFGRTGRRVRKVAVGVTGDWLADSGLSLRGDGVDFDRFTADHMARLHWQPGRRVADLSERIFEVTPYTEACRSLYLESRVLDLVAETLTLFVDAPCAAPLRAVDRRRLRRIEDFLEASDQPAVSLDRLAREAGVSLSTLQRLFRGVHGMSASEYIRRRNLERARAALDQQGLSVKQAAFLAGYTDAGNFAKAFRRHFGRVPRRS